MRRGEWWLALVLLLASLPVQAQPSPIQGPLQSHAPIFIASDADFTAANGVVAGSGTPADPYVISGWRFSIGASGYAIYVRNTTAHFVVTNNVIEAGTGVYLSAMASHVRIVNNEFLVMATGVHVGGGDVEVRDNAFIRVASYPHASAHGVVVATGSAEIHGNAFQYMGKAIVAQRGSVNVTGNDIHLAHFGVHLTATVAAHVEANIITRCVHVGIYLKDTIKTNVSGNDIASCDVGVELWGDKDADLHNNTITASGSVAVAFESVSGNLTANLIVDGRGNGVQVWNSVMVVANNTVSNHLGAGLKFMMSASVAVHNRVEGNGVGIVVMDEWVVRLRGNILANNTVGLDIGYKARASVAHLHANLVNGVSVDGAFDASERVYFYKAANVTIAGGVRDSGFSAGYYGSLTAQGGVVLYEVDTANVSGTLISHHNVGVHAVNSFNVVVANATLVNNGVGIHASATPSPQQVPPCVVSVKDSNVTLDVDPVGSAGIEIRGCFAQVLRTNVSVVDTGIFLDAAASGTIAHNTVHATKLGLDVQGRRGEVNITGNLVVQNRVGGRLSGTVGDVVDNRFEANAGAGLVIDRGANLRLLGNAFLGNGEGLADTRSCGGAASCSLVQAEGNLFAGNRGDGARVNGSSSFRGDAFLGNGGAGARLGSATLVGVEAARNGEDGISLTGRFLVRESAFHNNTANGATLVGEGELRASRFVRNDGAGLRVRATYIQALQLDVSHNLDGILFDETAPFLTLPDASVPGLYGALPGGPAPDPLDIHLSIIEGNLRDAVRADAALVNATYNYWGTEDGPALSIEDQVGAYQNGVSPGVRFLPYYTDRTMTTTGPLFLL